MSIWASAAPRRESSPPQRYAAFGTQVLCRVAADHTLAKLVLKLGNHHEKAEGAANMGGTIIVGAGYVVDLPNWRGEKNGLRSIWTRLSEFNTFDENNPPVLLCRDSIIRHRIVHEILFVFRNHQAISGRSARGLRECNRAFPQCWRDDDVTKQAFIDQRLEFPMFQQVIGAEACISDGRARR